MNDLEIEINAEFTEKLKEILKELAKPKKIKLGFADARTIVNDGLIMLGTNDKNILGFSKDDSEPRIRKVKAAQAWFKKMYEDGWRFNGQFEYEGLLYNGFIIMEKEIPNEKLEELINELMTERKLETPAIGERMKTTYEALKRMGYNEDEVKTTYYTPQVPPVKIPYETKETINKVKEPIEGFESDIKDFIESSQKEMKTLEEQFFDETGRHAVWQGKETKTFKEWKENRD